MTSAEAMDDLGELLRQTALADEARFLDHIARILDLDALVDERKKLWESVRQYLLLQEQITEPLVDGERANVAFLKEKSAPASIDLISMAKHPQLGRLIIEAALMGLLSVNLTQTRALRGKSAAADALLRYELTGGVTYEMHIEHTS